MGRQKKVFSIIILLLLSLPFVSAAAPIGYNLDFISDSSSQLIFVDVMKQSRDWLDQNWAPANSLQRQADGYPTQIPQGSISMVRTLVLTGGGIQTAQVNPAGQYTVLYDGDGDFQFSGDAAVVSQQPGRIIITLQPAEGTYIAITRSNVNNPVRNMRIIMPGFESTYQAKPFYPPFLQRLGNTSTIRFMNVMNTNRGACCYSLSEPQITWNDRTLLDENTQNTRAGMAVEHLVALANAAGKSPWFTISHLASDDYIRNFAQYVNANLDPTLDIYVEFSNEVWNNIFLQNAYVQQQGCADPETRIDDGSGGCDIYRSGRKWQGKRSGQMFTIFQQELTYDGRLVRVVASQGGYNGWTASMFNPIFQGLALVGQTADAIAIAPYFGQSVTNNIQQSGQMDSITVDQLLDLAEQNLRGETLFIINDAAQYAQQKGVRLVAYEGGHHLVATGGFENNQPWADKIIAAAHHPRMRGLYNAYLDQWFQNGGDLFAVYKYVNYPSKWGTWGTLDYVTQPDDQAPMYQGVMDSVARYLNFVPEGTPPPTAVCGNTIVETGEVCDGNSQPCIINGYSGSQSCNAQCSAFTACTSTQFCGDNVINGPETCDNGSFNGQPNRCNAQCSGITPLQSASLTQNLSMHWTFDPNTSDKTGNGYNGIITGNTVNCTVNGKIGQGCLVSNQGHFLYANGVPIPNSVPNGFGVASWVYFDTLGNKMLSSVGTNFNFQYNNGGGLDCNVQGSTGNYKYVLDPTFSPQLGRWYHLICTFNPADNTMRIYRDGVQTGVRNVGAFSQFVRNGVTGLSCNNIYYCPASASSARVRYDDVRVYSRALNASDATLLFAATPPSAVCGNAVVETSEVCDSNTQSCMTALGYSGTRSCNAQCSGFNACTSSQFCGDNIINGPETCDEGSLNGQPNHCSAQCTGMMPSVCGNSVIEAGEVCDGGSQTCSVNGYSGSQLCNGQCTGYNLCTTTQSCGDGLVNGPETCDDGSFNGQPNKCNNSCTGLTPSVCGNTVVEAGEICDSASQSCTANGYGGLQSCTAQCTGYDICISSDSCGDNIINGPETCDDGSLNGQPNRCNAQCDGITPSVCGNNIIESGEACDSSSQMCLVNGYTGSQSCNAQCSGYDLCTTPESCGDGLVNGPESCDSGSSNSQPGNCNLICSGMLSSTCGNGVVDQGEICW